MRTSIVILTVVLGIGCSSSTPPAKQPSSDVTAIIGSGATFPNPLYQKWIEEFRKKKPAIDVQYKSVGSGDGIRDFQNGKFDFAGSDRAMSDEQMKKVDRGVQLVPTTAGMIVIAYNMPDLPNHLKLTRDTYVDLFLGKIRYWNDERIKASNPGVKLPKSEIALAVRLDGSGTTFAFTNHLAAVSPLWAKDPGVGTSVAWPDWAVQCPGNEGVAAFLKRTPGSIGYVEYGLAERSKLSMAALENKQMRFVAPDGNSGSASLAAMKLPEHFRAFLPDPDGEDSYPIVTYTWIMAYKKYDDAKKADAVREFLTWSLGEGQQYSEPLGFVRLPDAIASDAIQAVRKINN